MVPLFRRESCRDTARVVKPSAFFPSRMVEGFWLACTPHYDISRGGFVNCGADAKLVI